ncbi:hypothetical protein BBP40_012392 [Aspergillus hancockii]|nr:hypothetical protein BBP40_012392 [Aspergillus hancockii]
MKLACAANHVATPHVQQASSGGCVYELGEISYLANESHAIDSLVAFTVIVADESVVTKNHLDATISSYLANDDVITKDFLGSVYLSATVPDARIDAAALNAPKRPEDASVLAQRTSKKTLVPGPYTAVISNGEISLYETYRLYPDEYRNFITGAYQLYNDMGTYAAFRSMSSKLWAPMIPVPSRIYSTRRECFLRDPLEWSKFAKAWCVPELHQPEFITGLSPLLVPDTMEFPSLILYPDEYFPMADPEAQKVFDAAVASIGNVFGMTQTVLYQEI